MPLRRALTCLGLAFLIVSPASAEIAGDKVRIGVLTDLSGPFQARSGSGSVEAARMAAEDFGGKINGKPIEILAGDHQNKPDIGVSLANRWFDVDKVDMITELNNSAVGFAVLNIAKQKNKMIILTGAGSDDFTGKSCAPDNSVHWTYDTYQSAKSVGLASAILGKTWFLVNADYAFGVALENSTREALRKAGATVVGSVRHPLDTTDYSSFVLQAKASNAEVIGYAPSDQVSAFRALREYEVTSKIVGFGLDGPADIRALGLASAQGVYTVTPWARRDDQETNAWVARYIDRRKIAPSSFQVAVYSATLNYLKGVQAADSTDPKAVIAQMRKMKFHDVFTDDGYLREDGRMVHSVELVQIKSPAESKSEWDFFKPVSIFKGDDVFRPLTDGHCPALAGK